MTISLVPNEPTGPTVDAKAVESIVINGDLSKLSCEERVRYYLHLCEMLGLNPATPGFQLLKLNGKEVLYATRGVTDQLAAIHRLSRKIVDGPKIVDLGGTKVIMAVCEATHPNGRTETATATVPCTDVVNGLMKAETKAKRRATLSILGLGLLDESELETIPGVRSRVSVNTEVTGELHVPQEIVDAAESFGEGPTTEQLASVYVDHCYDLKGEDAAAAYQYLVQLSGRSKYAMDTACSDLLIEDARHSPSLEALNVVARTAARVLNKGSNQFKNFGAVYNQLKDSFKAQEDTNNE